MRQKGVLLCVVMVLAVVAGTDIDTSCLSVEGSSQCDSICKQKGFGNGECKDGKCECFTIWDYVR
ncbi:hypothetical protein KIN20_028226 [Parelaphostrongylus tenuis]|uniref:Uncharacterized protein n=1 Tax=Parelaphostrongylus tenuis TaxID=148309 RepID=A0AAD5R0F9_PARTN|nr:hypothetical protein KIN20_028226 [Parelaphostrongylus tenuis]